ncbi:MAG: anthranilate synthase component I [Bdellovibrionales bacterium]
MTIYPAYDVFERNWKDGRHQTVWTRLVSDLETPVSALMKLGYGKPYSFLLESIEGGSVRGRYSIIGREPDLIWRCARGGIVSVNRKALQEDGGTWEASSRKPLDDLRALLEECSIEGEDQPQPIAAGLFGYLGYDMIRYLEKIPDDHPVGVDVPESVLIRPTLLAIFDQIDNMFTLATPVWHNPLLSAEEAYAKAKARLEAGLRDLERPLASEHFQSGIKETEKFSSVSAPVGANMTEADFLKMVERSKEYIKAGDIFQVVLSQRFSMPFASPAFDLYRAARRLEPSPFLFFFDFKDFSVVGSSPEILVRLRDGKVTVRPIAGTRPRGQGNRTDSELEAELLADPKELAEHLMLVDLGRNDVGRVAKTGSVKVTQLNIIERYKHVMHIVSNVEGALDPAYTPLEALMAGFPAGTVSGAPKVRAMEIIAELEPDRRGVYAGCVGYFASNGDMDTCIAIRTSVIKDGVLHVQAGAGIVYDSDAPSEFRECQAKARGQLRAAEEALRVCRRVK